MYLFTQRHGGQEKWETHLATQRHYLASSGEYSFISALDSSYDFSGTLTREEQQEIKFSAPLGFYADFDGDIDEVLGQSKLFLAKLSNDHALDMSQVFIWLTGGRGVHIEVPLQCFIPKVPVGGVTLLPTIFKELAMSVYVDTLDLRVYTIRRMWRVPNVKRSNGLYKVQVSFSEFLDTTPENYSTTCSSPRAPLPVSPATFNPRLGLLFAQAKDKIDRATKKRKSKKASHEQMLRFEGQFPDSFKLLLTGECVRPGVGWNQIALQVASFALALGKTEDQMVGEARGLIDSHSGDSDRYGSPRKRENELRNQYRFQQEHPAYEFSLGGVKSLFAKGTYTADLDWAGAVAPDVEDEPTAEAEGGEASPDVEDDAHDPEVDQSSKQDEDTGALVEFGPNGIFAITEDGTKRICPIGISKPCSLVTKEGKHVGFEFTAFLHGKEIGPAYVTLSNLRTKASFNDWVNGFATWQNATDLLVSHLLEAFRRRTDSKAKKMIVTSREGVDLVIYPGAKTVDDIDIIFACADQCLSPKERRYRFRGMHDELGAFRTDILSAPRLEDTPETREFFDKLWRINTPVNIGKIAGWFSAAFLTQLIRFHWKAFPLLQVWGQAGAGKTQTVELFSHMHYHLKMPKKISAAGNTFFPMVAAVTQSASLPVIFEELKPRQMAKFQLDQVQNLLRTNYNGERLERGSVNRDVAGGGTVVNGYDNVAPIMFIGEALESQSAILERCVSTPLSKEDRDGRSDEFEYCYARRQGGPISWLGRSMIDAAMAIKPDLVRDSVAKYRDLFKSRVSRRVYEDQNRPWHNYSVVLTGLDFMGIVLSEVFGDRYASDIEAMKEAVIESALTSTQKVISEAAKVLDVMGQLTRNPDAQYQIVKGVDYVTDGLTLDLKLRPAYAKYVRYQLSLKQEVLFDTDKAFIAAMERYNGLIARTCEDSSIYRNPFEPLFRFNCDTLAEDGCEPFEM